MPCPEVCLTTKVAAPPLPKLLIRHHRSVCSATRSRRGATIKALPPNSVAIRYFDRRNILPTQTQKLPLSRDVNIQLWRHLRAIILPRSKTTVTTVVVTRARKNKYHLVSGTTCLRKSVFRRNIIFWKRGPVQVKV